MKIKKLFATLLVGALAVGTLAGCGNKENDDKGNSGSNGEVQKITLSSFTPKSMGSQ